MGRGLQLCGYTYKQRIHAQKGLTRDNIKVMTRKAQGYYSNNAPQCVYMCSDIPREHMHIQSDKDISEYRS